MKNIIFVDFDNTIIDTNYAFCSAYNELYCNYPNFKTADSTLVNQYDFKDVCPLVDDVMKIFNHELFFKFAEFINDNAYEVIKELNRKYKIIIASIGSPRNIAHKSIWIENNLPFIKNYMFIINHNCHTNKSLINCTKDSIFIDDIPSNLLSVNSERKILFGEIFPWNDNWQGEHALNWTEVANKLL